MAQTSVKNPLKVARALNDSESSNEIKKLAKFAAEQGWDINKLFYYSDSLRVLSDYA